jgi:formylglycine-generating enzyme required for sulfatase activity
MKNKNSNESGAPKPDIFSETEVKEPELILIPEGDVIIGTSNAQVRELLRIEEWAQEWYSKDLFQAEQPQHRIHLPAFEIAKYPVTNFEYHEFVWSTNYRVPRSWIGFSYPEGLGTHPVVDISKYDAEAYIKWLNDTLKTQYRLPTEAEWERAARGDDNRLYPWGNDFDPWRCNTVESGKRGTTPVGNYSPGGDSIFGVTDLGGNVWEMTSTAFMPYPYNAEDGRENPDKDSKIVVRGGAWYYSRKLARCSAREGVLPTNTSPVMGFRIARSVK